MKANGNSLIVPNVVKGQPWSADKVKAICKSTHLYIRALRPLIGSDLQQPRPQHYRVPPAPTYRDLESLELSDAVPQSIPPGPIESISASNVCKIVDTNFSYHIAGNFGENYARQIGSQLLLEKFKFGDLNV